MPITLIFREKITREIVKRDRSKIYLFGDNLIGKGRGGQAREMRGELNAIGIPTKKKPAMTEDSFFTDAEFEKNKEAIDAAIAKIPKNATVIVPMAGLGTGRAQLEKRAPKTLKYIEETIRNLQR
jgi:hypothetical protein